jgi:hypothetical protein
MKREPEVMMKMDENRAKCLHTFWDWLEGDALQARALAVPVEPVPVSPPDGASIAIARDGQ